MRAKIAFVLILVGAMALGALPAAADQAMIVNGTAWLAANQNPDGSFGGEIASPATVFQSTSQALRTLSATRPEPAWSAGIAWMTAQDPAGVDYISRKIRALAPTGADLSALVAVLAAAQNADGGWGADAGFDSDLLDTSLALAALSAAGAAQALADNAVLYLLNRQNGDGGFGLLSGDDSAPYNTALAMDALLAWQAEYGSLAVVTNALSDAGDWLVTFQNPDGGWGDPASTVFESGLAGHALALASHVFDYTSVRQYLEGAHAGGAWNANAYETAIGVRALSILLTSNLVIESGDIEFSEDMPLANEAVAITATVANIGLGAVDNVKVRFYNGDPAGAGVQIGADQTIPTIAAGGSAQAALTTQFALTGTYDIYVVVDPDNAVDETSEIDNQASATLHVVVPAPDPEVLNTGLSFSPASPSQEQAFTFSALVTNVGRLDAANVLVRFYDGDPSAGGTVIGEDTLAALAVNASATASVSYSIATAGTRNLYVRVDPDNALAESREDNNQAMAPVTVTARPDLWIGAGDVLFTPAGPDQGASFTITVTVRNRGAATAPSFKVSAWGGDPDAGADLWVEWTLTHLAAGDSISLEAYPLALASAGTYTPYARADSANVVAEIREDNNEATGLVTISPVPDLSVSAMQIRTDPTFLLPATDFTAFATVTNQGDGDALTVVAGFYDGDPGAGGSPMGTQTTIPLLAGGASVEITSTLQFAGTGLKEIWVMADPGHAIAEIRENNNTAGRGVYVSARPPFEWADSFVACLDDNGRLYTAKSNGDGTFGALTYLWYIGSGNARGVCMEDFDSDGDLDIIAGRNASGDSAYFLFENNGAGAFHHKGQVGLLPGAASYAMDMTAGDFNNDGRPDFIAQGNNATTGIFLQNPDGTFTATMLALSNTGRGLDCGDLDDDGNLDVVRATNPGYVFVMLGNGDGTFAAPVNLGDFADDPYGLAVADFDNDGMLDFVMNRGSNGDTYIYWGNGNGTFTAGGYVASLDHNNHGSFDAYDLNADGAVDIVASDYSGKHFYYYPGNGNGTFGAKTTIGTATNYVLSVSAPPSRQFGAPYAIIAPLAQEIALGGTANLDGSGSEDSDDFGTITSHAWTFGDGGTASGAAASHAYSSGEGAEGIYTVRLLVTDNSGNKDDGYAAVTVKGAGPTADAGGPYDVGEDAAADGVYTFSLDGTGSMDAGGVASWEWVLGDGLFDDFADGVADGFVPSEGTWEVNAGAYRQTNESADRSRNLAGDANWDDCVVETDVTLVSGTGGEAHVLLRAQDINNNYEFIFRGRGLNDVLLYRRVNGSATSLYEFDLPYAINTGTAYHLKAEVSGNVFRLWVDDDLVGEVTDATFPRGKAGLSTYRTHARFDNFTVTRRATGPTPSFDCSARSFPGTLTVTDAAGQTDADAFTVTVHPGALPVPVPGADVNLAEADGVSGAWGVHFDGTGSSDDVGIISYAWDFGDGGTATGATPYHVFTPAGFPASYTVTLTVTDNALQATSASLVVTIDLSGDGAPVADPGGPYSVNEESAVGGMWTAFFDGSGSTDDLGIARYEWDFGDGGTATTWYGKDRNEFFCAGTELYGYDVVDAGLRVLATQNATFIRVVNLETGAEVGSTTLNKYQEWTAGSPGDNTPFKVEADKPVVAMLTDGAAHASFIPSLDAGAVGHEFIFRMYKGSGFHVYAVEDAVVRFYNTGGTLVEERGLAAGEYYSQGLADNVYHVRSTGRIAMQSTGSNSYTAVPSVTGDGAGRLFYAATYAGTTGCFAVFAYEDADVTVYDLDTGAQLYTQNLSAGGHWYQNGVGTRRMRFVSTGDMGVWAGDTESGTTIEQMGDDISVAAGRQGMDFHLHGLKSGFVLFAPHAATVVNVDGLVETLNADEYRIFAGGSWNHVTADKPVIIQTLGEANTFNDLGTYLGGTGDVRNRYAATGDYTLTLTVYDQAGQSDSASTTVTVGDSDPPVAAPGGPYSANESNASAGTYSVALDAGASTDDFAIYRILWDFDDSNGVDWNAPNGTGAAVTAAYSQPGVYTATVRVIDNALQATDQTVLVTVSANDPPVADAGGPYDLGEEVAKRGEFLVTLDGSGSTDDFGIYRYEWDLGDSDYDDFTGTTLNTAKYYVSGGVTQDGNVTATGTGSWGQRYIFSKQEYLRETGTEYTARIYVASGGNGQVMWGLKNNRARYHYDQMPYAIYFNTTSVYIYEDATSRGSKGGFARNTWYDVKIVLKDRQGATYYIRPSGAADWTVLYDSTYATRATRFLVGMDVLSSAVRMDDLEVNPKNIGARVTHAYADPGLYTVTLTVTDQALQSHSDATALTLTMGNPPVADAGGPYTGEVDSMVRFNAAATTDDNAPARFEWDFGDGHKGEGAGVQYFYRAPGNYTATLTVYDNMEQWDTATADVTIAAGLTPTADPGGPYMGGANGPPVYFDASDSTDDAGITDYRWDLTMMSDDFSAPAINDTLWQYGTTGTSVLARTAAGAVQLSTTSSASWPRAYLFSKVPVVREPGVVLRARVRTVGGFGYSMVGWKDNTTGYSYTNLVHAIYFRNDGTIRVYEDGSDRGQKATYTADTWHDVAIELKYGGAYYYLNGVLIYTSTYSGESDLRPGITIANLNQEIDDVEVARLARGASPAVTYPLAGTFTGTLTVHDGAGKTNTAPLTVQISDNMPPRVICVPWVASDPKFPHETWDGKEITLKGIVKDADPVTYQWNFGDGSLSAVMNVTNAYDLSIKHTYPAAPVDTPFVATLMVWDSAGNSSFDTYNIGVKAFDLETEVNVAIDDALWYLHQQMSRSRDVNDGRWAGYSSYYASAAGSCLHAFQIHSHLAAGDPSENPYVETVGRGMRYMFSLLKKINIGAQTYGNPDVNGNGYGVEVNPGYPIYEGGMVMMAIAASATPLAWAPEDAPDGVGGRLYFDVLQDMADAYAWGQYDHATVGGGWRYSWNTGPDNSACQWGAMGLESSEKYFGVVIPDWVKERNLVWINYSWDGTGFGYSGAGNGVATTPAGISQLALVGLPATDWRWINAESYLAQVWDSWYNDSRHYYAMYGLAKSMRIALPEQVTLMAKGTPWEIDWYMDPDRGLARHVVNDQKADGSFNISGQGTYNLGEGPFRTSWGVVILSKTLFVKEPVADAGPDQVYGVDWEFTFDGSGSYHKDPFRSIVLYEWDVNGDGTYDYSSTTPTAKHTYHGLGAFTVTLRVTDDNIPPIQDTDTTVITIAVPPHAPIALPGGPYQATAGVPITLNGSASFDIDPTDFISAYHWELAGGFPYDYTDASGPYPTWTWNSGGIFAVGLKVYDNGVLNDVNGNSQVDEDEKLFHIAWTTVTVYANVAPEAKAGGPYVVDEGTPLTLDGSGSSDANGDALTYAWDLDMDGAFDDSTDVKPVRTWSDSGAYTAGLMVSDGDLTHADFAVVTVNDLSPAAAFVHTPDPQFEGSVVQFTDQSTSPQDDIVAWAW
ncbi:MAG: PKD domain-containing protein, partial [Proteobacteria bacterium]|nr:PKD domain-containing protein [Pseudomonadota bacterium]